MKKTTRYRGNGFTLVELLVCVAIIAMLSAAGVLGFSGVQTQVKKKKTSTLIKLIENSLDSYYLDNGEYPAGTGAAETNSSVLFTELGGYTTTGAVDDAKECYADYLDPNGSGANTVSNTTGAYLIMDPFEQAVRYIDAATDSTINNPDFDLWSLGKKADDALDDITNW